MKQVNVLLRKSLPGLLGSQQVLDTHWNSSGKLYWSSTTEEVPIQYQVD